MNTILKGTNNKVRLAYLDWLKIWAVTVVFLGHSCRFFDHFEWYAKNEERSFFFTLCIAAIGIWIMPVFFFVSGASLSKAINVKSRPDIIMDRTQRLLPPLILGIFLLSPHQVYFERLTNHQFSGSFIDFIPYYFVGWYGFGGNFAWPGLHLWYLMFLYVYTLLALILLPKINIDKFEHTVIGKILSGKWSIVFIILVSCIPMMLIPTDTFIGMQVWGTWNIPSHFLTMMIGYFCYAKKDFAANIPFNPFLLLIIGLVFSALVVRMPFYIEYGTSQFYLSVLLKSAACWFCLFSFLKFFYVYMNFKNKFLEKASAAAMPAYILHQPVIVLIGYFVIKLNWGIFPEYALIVTSSFLLITIFYHLAIKRTFLKVLFGIPLKKKVSDQTSIAT